MHHVDETRIPHNVTTVEGQPAVWPAGANLIRQRGGGETYKPTADAPRRRDRSGSTTTIVPAWLVPEPQVPPARCGRDLDAGRQVGTLRVARAGGGYPCCIVETTIRQRSRAKRTSTSVSGEPGRVRYRRMAAADSGCDRLQSSHQRGLPPATPVAPLSDDAPAVAICDDGDAIRLVGARIPREPGL